jgi:FkbM family methyltransferase
MLKQMPSQPTWQPPVLAQVGSANSVMPPHLHILGLQLIGTEEVLDTVVVRTSEHAGKYGYGEYAGETFKVRIVTGDGVAFLVDEYGLSSLGGQGTDANGMMNMLDIGGNYGRISIAAFKKYPRSARIVVIEPIPSTYLLLKWNLWLNGIPELTLEELRSNPSKPGVVALHGAVADADGKTIDMCYTPPETMGARLCNCSHGFTHSPQEQCVHVVTRSVESLLASFGTNDIAFLKVDCEGCEVDVLPALMNLTASSKFKIARFGGELHALPNHMEDFACMANGGEHFVHVCFVQGLLQTLNLPERCTQGAGRPSCSRVQSIEGIPPSEW